MKLAIVIPSNDTVYIPFVMSLLALQNVLLTSPPISDEEFDMNIMVEQNSLLVSGRQNLTAKALEWGADWILMLDSDMKFPADIVHRLLKHGRPIVACNYVKRQVPAVPVTKGFDGKRVLTRKDSTGLEKVKFTGFGVTLVHKSVFERFPAPNFDTVWMKHDDTKEIEILGEDVFFFEGLRHFTGQDIYIDHDVSKDIGHIGIFEYTNNLAEILEEADLNG